MAWHRGHQQPVEPCQYRHALHAQFFEPIEVGYHLRGRNLPGAGDDLPDHGIDPFAMSIDEGTDRRVSLGHQPAVVEESRGIQERAERNPLDSRRIVGTHPFDHMLEGGSPLGR
ncbi:Uncharacterised protein [Mycobacteroides abscessus subsp. abscessus]|nr:Uncharacterised protein [Mycobacteroides abscessus subsp. abscessus]